MSTRKRLGKRERLASKVKQSPEYAAAVKARGDAVAGLPSIKSSCSSIFMVQFREVRPGREVDRSSLPRGDRKFRPTNERVTERTKVEVNGLTIQKLSDIKVRGFRTNDSK